MEKLDLTTRFIIFLAATLVGVLGAMNAWFYIDHKKHLNEELESRTIGVLDFLESSVGYYIKNYEDELILELGTEAVAKDGIVFLSIKDLQGNKYFEAGNSEQDGIRNFKRKVIVDKKEIGIISLSVDTSQLIEEVASSLYYSICLFILSMALIGGMIFIFFKKTIMIEINKSQHDKEVFHDIAITLESRVKDRTRELLLAKEEAEKANGAKTEFLSRMSHELRTPMNAILGFGQLLECDDELTAEQKPQVKEILNAGYHLLELINEVLDLTQIETGNINIENKPVNCYQLLDESLRLIEPLAEKRGISLQHEKIQNIEEVLYADPTRLKEILLNLLSNAVKYSREGGTITVCTEELTSKRVRIKVIDTGEGLTKGQLQRLFSPFERLGAEYKNIEGSGIGLVISERIAKMMGGQIGVESEPGRGSTFWVELDTIASIKDTMDSQSINDEGSQEVRIGEDKDYTVLYIEDNPSCLRLMEYVFSKYINVNFLVAMIPEKGLELAARHNPDLIILDVNMPDMDGYEMLGRIRNIEGAKNARVVGLNESINVQDLKKAISAGFADYLGKPVNAAQFIANLPELLESVSIDPYLHPQDRIGSER